MYVNPTAKVVKGPYFKLTLPKVKGVYSYTLYTSKEEESGYKKVGTYVVSKVKKTATVKKIAGKSLKKYVDYYFKIVPTFKIGGVKQTGYRSIHSWYIRTVYR